MKVPIKARDSHKVKRPGQKQGAIANAGMGCTGEEGSGRAKACHRELKDPRVEAPGGEKWPLLPL